VTEAALIAALSLPVFWVAGAFGLAWASALAAGAVGLAFVIGSIVNEMRSARTGASSARDQAGDAKDVPPAAISAAMNATYIGAVFLWGAGALTFGYGLTELYWQHWWQYAAAMILLAGVALGYAAVLPRPGSAWAGPTWLSRMTRLTLAQGVGAAAGLVFLIGSGKLIGDKPDWLANHVFLFGGIAIAVLSAVAVRAQWRHLSSGAADEAVEKSSKSRRGADGS
jgi:hypothetical protein